jgi:hypothetical protein
MALLLKTLKNKAQFLDTLGKYIDYEKLTINNKYQDEKNDRIKNLLNEIKIMYFGNYVPTKFKRVVLPFYLQTNNIIQLFKTILNNTKITESDIKTNIIEPYNNNNYQIICKNGKEYMRFTKEEYDIPLNKINSVYEDLIKENLSKDINLLNAYNEKEYIIKNISIKNKTYNFDFLTESITIPLMNIYNKSEITNPIKRYNTDFHFEKITIPITNYYEITGNNQNIYGEYQEKYSQYILLEKVIPYIDSPEFQTLEDIMILDSVILDETINNLWESYIKLNTKIIEFDYFHLCKEKKEIIYIETLKGIIPRRFFSLIVYISRLYNDSSLIDVELEQFKDLYNEVKENFEIYNKNKDITALNNSIIDSFDKWFQSIHTYLTDDEIKSQYLDIVKGVIISKLNNLDIVKQTRRQINKTKRDLIDITNDNVKTIQKISKDIIKNPQKVVNDGMTSMKEHISKIFKSEENDTVDQTERLDGLELESSFITETLIQNRVQKWVFGPKKVSTKTYYPTIIQFIDDYINDEYDIDLVSYKNRENVCQEISELKNKIKNDTKEIKYLLPKTYFDDDFFMENLNEELEKENKSH